jgi:hypothetical protein
MASDSPAVIVFNEDGYAVDTVIDVDGNRGLHTTSPFTALQEKLVSTTIVKEETSDTAYYMLIDLDNSKHKHDISGSAIKSTHIIGRAFKSAASAKWVIQPAIVLDINATSAEIAVLHSISLALRDTSRFSIENQAVYKFPNLFDFTVSEGELLKQSTGTIINVTEINTATSIEDIFGDTVVPSIGDMIVRAVRQVGVGTIDFAYNIQYFVE